jgi:hypothetical protein
MLERSTLHDVEEVLWAVAHLPITLPVMPYPLL